MKSLTQLKSTVRTPLLLIITLFALAGLTLTPASADPPAPPVQSKGWQDFAQQLDKSEKDLLPVNVEAERLDQITTESLAATQFSLGCISTNETELTKLQQSIDSLGESSPQDDRDLQTTRNNLGQKKKELEKTLSQCKLLSLRATQLQEKASAIKQDRLKQLLFASNDSMLNFLLRALQDPIIWATESQQILATLTALPVNMPNIRMALLYGLAGMLAGGFWSTYKRRQFRQQPMQLAETSPTLAVVWRSLIRVMPFLLLFGLTSLSFLFNPSGVDAINDLVSTLLVFGISYAILRAMLRPSSKLTGFTPMVPNTSRKLFFWARMLLFTTLLGALFHSPLFNTTPPSNLLGLIRIALGTLAGLSLIRLIWLLRKHLARLRQYHLHLLASLVILAAIAALWLGYKNFSTFLFTGTFGTLFILLIGWLSLRIPTEIFDGMDEGIAAWQRRLRKRLGLEEGHIIPGLVWLRLAHVLLVFGGMAILLLRLWGMSEQAMQVMLAKLLNGFQVGEFTLEPVRIIGGLLLMAVLISLTHLLKNNLANSWLRRTGLSRGAKEATTTIAGYIGILLAILIGLSVAGIQFTNLAIIAGALSVGIGFGLQNIVNNFVSGLILLFERPIRRGDWIRVGTSEGYVQDISIRSTVIQTFDRSDIIVPNSELISNQVTNMMLNNQYGRIIIPVNVAYGSDTGKVMKILQKVAEKNPAVLREQGELRINVFFRSFGEYAMKFELRCQIKDVENLLPVTSELNLAIEKAFRTEGIQIPYPQSTVHLPSMPDLTAQTPAKSDDLE